MDWWSGGFVSFLKGYCVLHQCKQVDEVVEGRGLLPEASLVLGDALESFDILVQEL